MSSNDHRDRSPQDVPHGQRRGPGNGLVFTTRLSNLGRTSRNGLENELVKLRVQQKNSRPNHPTTCGKVERFQQTMKKWLHAQPAPTTIRPDGVR